MTRRRSGERGEGPWDAGFELAGRESAEAAKGVLRLRFFETAKAEAQAATAMGRRGEGSRGQQANAVRRRLFFYRVERSGIAKDHPEGEAAAGRAKVEAALPVLHREGGAEEVAEAEMNLGLTLQNLAALHKARIQDAIAAYQRALRTFDKHRHPKEFAILQNNLASAFMSMPFTDEKSKMREALAVGAFEEGLSVVTLIDHPAEYAMLQNNLGNALQYASSSHPVENGYRALEAYNEALKVRTANDTPGEYANTISNKANCLANLPDDPADPGRGNQDNLRAAVELYREARRIYLARGQAESAEIVAAAIQDIEADLSPVAQRGGRH